VWQERRCARDLLFCRSGAVYFIAIYAKNEKENISDAEKKALAKIVRPIKRQEH
jgi:hypothetical protein